jgi:TM2 domain-containing membrane protein YozV
MGKNSPQLPLLLSLTVFPGLGHLYLKRKAKGLLYIFLTSLILLGGLARFMSVMFALANVRPPHGDPVRRALHLLAETWRLDTSILLAFLGALVLVWLLAAADCWWTMKEERHDPK